MSMKEGGSVNKLGYLIFVVASLSYSIWYASTKGECLYIYLTIIVVALQGIFDKLGAIIEKLDPPT